MNDLLRLLAYARRYWFYLTCSVLLMALVGAAHASIALLIGPIFDRVLNPASPDTPVLLFTIPIFDHPVYLNQFVPAGWHNVWTMVGFAILVVFAVKGICDYLANYMVNYVGCSAVTDLRNTVFEKVLRHGSEFFESHSTGRLMSSIMNDIEKIQVATSHILADLLRQSFVVMGLLFVVLYKDWKLAAASLVVTPLILVPTARIGRRIRGTRPHTGPRRRGEPDPARDPERASSGESIQHRGLRITPVPRRCAAAAEEQSEIRAPTGNLVAANRNVWRAYHRAIAHLRKDAD